MEYVVLAYANMLTEEKRRKKVASTQLTDKEAFKRLMELGDCVDIE